MMTSFAVRQRDRLIVASLEARPELSYREIGRMYGVSLITVHRAAKRAGLNRRKLGGLSPSEYRAQMDAQVKS
jgi:DNA-directed RNA polymerase specialized sigma24 family protein